MSGQIMGCFEILDERFERLIVPTTKLDLLYNGCRWAEGPAYFPAGRYLIWSDIPNDRMLRYDECNGAVSVFRQPCGYANGITVDRQGRLVNCEHGNRRVTRTEIDGSIAILADRHMGHRLNSPNDVVVDRAGNIWFTDPTYGIDSDYEGNRGTREQAGNYVYRVDAQSGDVRIVANDFVQPNGLAFSIDETLLYIVDSGGSDVKNGPRHMRKFAVGEGGKLTDLGLFAESTAGFFDGFRLDEDGRIWTSAGDGVHCYEPDGTLIGKILISEPAANLCFGGPRQNYLYICATTSLYGVRLAVNGHRTF